MSNEGILAAARSGRRRNIGTNREGGTGFVESSLMDRGTKADYLRALAASRATARSQATEHFAKRQMIIAAKCTGLSAYLADELIG
jgi:hypothetical protein